MTLCEETSAEVAEVEADAAQTEWSDLLVKSFRQTCVMFSSYSFLCLESHLLTANGKFGGAVQGRSGIRPKR